ncbi:MAG: tRNA pseudouridine(38-40) synthase TruA [Leptospiraceae bacterium]|nr:tRNA pseudouridine(38-40) synthase TruA [Leptospiraceae bacterium]
MKIGMTVEYDGSAYCGFQLQKDQNSVQAELERALRIALRTPVRIHCAGRTDSGVHALGQVVHFSVPAAPPLERLVYSVNSLLPRDIAISHAEIVPDNFHARFSCLSREYVYAIYQAPFRPAAPGLRALWLRGNYNWSRAAQAIPHLLGEKDFASFTRRALAKSGERTWRRIDAIDIVEVLPYVFLYIRGSGFLHNMVRILAGTLLDVAKEKLPPEAVAGIVASADRLRAGVTLKPDALYFLYAQYADYPKSGYMPWLRRFLLEKLEEKTRQLVPPG